MVLPGGGPVNKNPVCTFVANMLHLLTKNAGIFFKIKTKPVSKSGNTEGALTMMGEKKTLYSSGCWQSCLLPRLKSGSGR